MVKGVVKLGIERTPPVFCDVQEPPPRGPTCCTKRVFMLLKALELPQEAAVVGPIRQELDSVLSSMLQNNAAEAQTCVYLCSPRRLPAFLPTGPFGLHCSVKQLPASGPSPAEAELLSAGLHAHHRELRLTA